MLPMTELLSRVTPNDVSNEAFPYSSAKEIVVRGVSCMAFRISYVGELGAVVMGNKAILIGDEAVGHITSAGYGYSVDSDIAYGYLPIEHAAEGTKEGVLYFGNRAVGEGHE